MNKKILEIKNLKKTFQYNNEKIQILKNLNLTFKKGELVALIGPSGSGKSTLLHMIALLEKPTSGKIFFFNKNTNNLTESEIDNLRKKNLSLIFQNNNLISDLSVIENVMLPLLIRNNNPAQSLKKSNEILKIVNLINRSKFYPNDLSGGEQQRVAIARAFMINPKVLFADEPTGNLDQKTASSVIDLLFELNERHGTTLVLVTHDEKLAQRCSRRLSMRAGIMEEI